MIAPEAPATVLAGEELVVAYVAYVDRCWVIDPDMVRVGYAHLGEIATDADQREATIMDTDGTRPEEWVFVTEFLAALAYEGVAAALPRVIA